MINVLGVISGVSFPLLYLLHRISCNEADSRFLICDRKDKPLMFYVDWFVVVFLQQKYFHRVNS